jgi:hypothetical protein
VAAYAPDVRYACCGERSARSEAGILCRSASYPPGEEPFRSAFRVRADDCIQVRLVMGIGPHIQKPTSSLYPSAPTVNERFVPLADIALLWPAPPGLSPTRSAGEVKAVLRYRSSRQSRSHHPLRYRGSAPCSRSSNVQAAAGPRAVCPCGDRSALPSFAAASVCRTWLDRARCSPPAHERAGRTALL